MYFDGNPVEGMDLYGLLWDGWDRKVGPMDESGILCLGLRTLLSTA